MTVRTGGVTREKVHAYAFASALAYLGTDPLFESSPRARAMADQLSSSMREFATVADGADLVMALCTAVAETAVTMTEKHGIDFGLAHVIILDVLTRAFAESVVSETSS